MSRRKLFRREDYDRALRRGRGVGEGKSYKPFIQVHDFGSRGRSSKMPGVLIDRPHHFLSDHETRFHAFVEFDDTVIDIREQFPILPLEFSIAVAKELGIRFPLVRKTKIPSVRTVDSLVTRAIGKEKYYTAYAVKEAAELRDKRVLELLEIERVCCELMGIRWLLVLDTHIPRIVAENLVWASQPMRGLFKEEYAAWENPDNLTGVLEELSVGTHSNPILIEKLSKVASINSEFSMNLLRSLVWKKRIIVDLSKLIVDEGEITILGKADSTYSEAENYDIAG